MTNKMDKIKITENELKKIIKENVATLLAKKLPKFFSKSTLKKAPKFTSSMSLKKGERALPKFVTGSSVKRNEIPKFVTGSSVKRGEVNGFLSNTSFGREGVLPNFVYNINEENTDTKMAKFQITESELKQLIGESVVSVLNEARYNTYGVSWDDLTDDQKQNYAKMYGNKAGAGYYADQNGNRWTSGYAAPSGYTHQYDMDKMRDFYSKEQKRFAKNTKRNGITPELYQKVTKENGQLRSQLSQAQSLNNGYKNAISQISQALGQQLAEAAGTPAPFDSSLAGAPGATAPTADQQAAMSVKSAVPNLEQILKSINDMKNKVGQLTKANQTLTAQNKSLATRIKNTTSQSQLAQVKTPVVQARVTAPAQPSGLAQPKVAAPGTAQA